MRKRFTGFMVLLLVSIGALVGTVASPAQAAVNTGYWGFEDYGPGYCLYGDINSGVSVPIYSVDEPGADCNQVDNVVWYFQLLSSSNKCVHTTYCGKEYEINSEAKTTDCLAASSTGKVSFATCSTTASAQLWIAYDSSLCGSACDNWISVGATTTSTIRALYSSTTPPGGFPSGYGAVSVTTLSTSLNEEWFQTTLD